MRRRCTALALTTILAAGCSSGHRAAPPPWARHPGVYSAVVAGRLLKPQHGDRAGPPQRILFDTATGRFRVDMTGGPRLHGYTTHTVFDGRMATEVVGASGRTDETAYRGSPAFILDQLGGIDVRLVRAFLTGAPPPRGVRVRVVSDGPPARLVATTGLERLQVTIRRVNASSAGDFRAARGHPISTVRQLHPGTSPGPSIAAYWLGPTWDGHRAGSSSATTGQDTSYTIAYPHLAIAADDEELPGMTGDTPLTLADGTHATLAVVHPDGDGSYSFDSSSGAIEFATTGTASPGPLALVFLPHTMITLSGTAVTDASALFIARALRPL